MSAVEWWVCEVVGRDEGGAAWDEEHELVRLTDGRICAPVESVSEPALVSLWPAVAYARAEELAKSTGTAHVALLFADLRMGS